MQVSPVRMMIDDPFRVQQFSLRAVPFLGSLGQRCVSLSTSEVEYVSMSDSLKDVLFTPWFYEIL